MGSKHSRCVFCTIVEKNENLIYQDEFFVMFNDIKPDAKVHIQAVPREHIKNINFLNKKHVEMIEHMKTKALIVLKEKFGDIGEIK
jgi:diadenosine tetraphosphate (Ap4A) HIT family hydrolase